MRHWFADGVFRTILRNASYLGSSKLVGAGLSLVALACAGRALSPALFGLLMIVHAYASGAGDLVKFQTWQLVIRYGAPALQADDRRLATDVVRFSCGLDLSSGMLGMALALIALPLLAPRFGIAGEDFWLTFAYCTLIPTMTAATPTGVLRVLDRFDLIAGQQIVTPAIRAVGAVASLVLHLGFPGLVVTWYVGDLAGDIALWLLAIRELNRRGLRGALRPGLFGTARRIPGAWGFVTVTNVAHSLYSAWGPVSNLVVAGMAGPVAAGLYKIASTLMDSASKPADLLSRGFYPEIMRLDPASRRPWQLAVRTGLLAGAIGFVVVCVVAIGGRPLIGLVFGHKYLDATGLLQLMTWSLTVSMATFPLEPLLYMVGRQRAALVAQIVAAAVYLAMLVTFTQRFGLMGAGIAYLAGTLVVSICMAIPTLQSYRARAGHARAPAYAAAG